MKKVSWDTCIVDRRIKKRCECQGCSGCLLNSQCKTFTSHKCKKVDEWRCSKCKI